jgi:hypothetical protein
MFKESIKLVLKDKGQSRQNFCDEVPDIFRLLDGLDPKPISFW